MSDEVERPAAGHEPARLAPRQWSAGKAAAEVVLIALGVFLGLAGEQWRDQAERRDRADEALRRIRTELAANAAAVSQFKDYHADTQRRLRDFFALTPSVRAKTRFGLEGVQPAQFERSAWQLAQDTQALADIDADLAFTLAQVYGVQERYTGLTEGITTAMYLRPPNEDATAFLRSLAIYYGDVVLLEPKLLELYGAVLPRIDHALAR